MRSDTLSSPLFHIGQIVDHKRFGYRGVIYSCDLVFSLSNAWYEQMATSQPPKDRPWYGVLVDGQQHATYVAERNLALSSDKSQIDHPELGFYFDQFDGVEYSPRAFN